MKKAAVYALTPQGAELGRRLAVDMGGDLFLSACIPHDYQATSFERLADLVAEQFHLYHGHVFVAAAGIVVRTIAPLLKSKQEDPAVVVLDQTGRFVISLLSGHLGGANKLAQEIARMTGGQAIITTATDAVGVPALDVLAQERDLAIANLEAVKVVSRVLLSEGQLQIWDPEDRLGLRQMNLAAPRFRWIDSEEQWVPEEPGVWVGWRQKAPHSHQLVLQPRCLIAGIGCNRGTDPGEIVDLVRETFQKHALALESLQCITTIEAKKDEEGLKGAAADLGVPLFFFGPAELNGIDVPNPSATVRKHMGVSSVCEATALLKSGKGRLLVPKTKGRNATLAVVLES
jgi:cobalt-precorrin 5A hydrolase